MDSLRISLNGKPSETPIGQQLLDLARCVSQKADEVDIRVAERVAPIASQELVAGQELGKSEEWPPFLQEIRLHLNRIETSLHRIENSANRIAL